MGRIADYGVGFTGAPFRVNEVASIVAYAEKLGFGSAWFAEDPFLRDALTMMSACATRTSRIKLGSGIVSAYTRHPVLIAQSIAGIDELTGGRTILGIGTGVVSALESIGIRVEKPLRAMRDCVGLIRKLLAGGMVNFEGEVFKIRETEIFASPEWGLLGAQSGRKHIPIYMAAMGPKMLKLAGEIADGVLLSAGSNDSYVKNIASRKIAEGSSTAGRSPNVACHVLTCVEGTRKELLSLKALLATIIVNVPEEFLEGSGVEQSSVQRIRKVLSNGEFLKVAEELTDRTASNFCAMRSANEVIEKFREYVKAGISTPVVFPVAENVGRAKAQLERIAQELLSS